MRKADKARTTTRLESDSDLFELVGTETRPSEPIEGVVVGRLVEVGDDGVPRVDFAENPGREPLPARSTVPLDSGAIGSELALAFEGGDAERPIVLGRMRSPVRVAQTATRALVDGERVVLEGRNEVTLRCGKASITLTRDGKVRIRGADVLSRSSGRHRIKGGSVSIN